MIQWSQDVSKFVEGTRCAATQAAGHTPSTPKASPKETASTKETGKDGDLMVIFHENGDLMVIYNENGDFHADFMVI